MKRHAHSPKHARPFHRGRKAQPQGPVRALHWIGQMVVGVAPRAWMIQAANDPQA